VAVAQDIAALGAAEAAVQVAYGALDIVINDMARSGVDCNALAPFAATRVTESIRPASAHGLATRSGR
jgi:hypothetical protein